MNAAENGPRGADAGRRPDHRCGPRRPADADGATAHEEGSRDTADALGAGALGARGRAEPWDQRRRDLQSGPAREERGAGLVCSGALSEAEFEVRLYGRGPEFVANRAKPDPVYMHLELRRAGMTLELLRLEYLEQNPIGYRYTAFCDVYRRWIARRGLSMRQGHKAGEKCFVDYSVRQETASRRPADR